MPSSGDQRGRLRRRSAARTAVLAGLAAWLAATAIALADDGAPAVLLDEPPFQAELTAIDGEWNLSFKAGDKLRVVAARDLAYFGHYRDAEAGPQVLLADGGVLRADVLHVDTDRVVIGDASGLARGRWDESTLPRAAVRGILWQPPAAPAERDRLLDQLARRADGDEQLLLVGGETVAGRVTTPLAGRFAPGEAAASFTVQTAGAAAPLALPASRVVAQWLGGARPATPPAGAWLGLDDGSLVQVAATAVRGPALELSLAAGGRLRAAVPDAAEPRRFWRHVTYVEPVTPRARWLSDLPHLGYKQIPFLSVEWPLGLDRCTLGSRLRTGPVVVRKGLGMPSAARVAYDVAGYRKLEAELAIDERAGRGGSVLCKVLLQSAGGEWRVAYESPVIRGGDPPLPIRVPLAGAVRLALVVEFGERGDEADYANWLLARLVK